MVTRKGRRRAVVGRTRPGQVLVNRGDDADARHCRIVEQGDKSVIPERCHSRMLIDLDRDLYRTRNVIERSIS